MQTPYLHLTQPDYKATNWYAAMNANLQTIDQHIQIIEQKLNSNSTSNPSGTAAVLGNLLFGATNVTSDTFQCSWNIEAGSTFATASKCICQVIFNEIKSSNDKSLTAAPIEMAYTYEVVYEDSVITVTVSIDDSVVIPTSARALIILTAVT